MDGITFHHTREHVNAAGSSTCVAPFRRTGPSALPKTSDLPHYFRHIYARTSLWTTLLCSRTVAYLLVRASARTWCRSFRAWTCSSWRWALGQARAAGPSAACRRWAPRAMCHPRPRCSGRTWAAPRWSAFFPPFSQLLTRSVRIGLGSVRFGSAHADKKQGAIQLSLTGLTSSEQWERAPPSAAPCWGGARESSHAGGVWREGPGTVPTAKQASQTPTAPVVNCRNL